MLSAELSRTCTYLPSIMGHLIISKSNQDKLFTDDIGFAISLSPLIPEIYPRLFEVVISLSSRNRR
jgi:hypothetical protein